MTEQEKRLAKKRGRPATGRGQTIGVRFHAADLLAIDIWRADQEPMPTRPEAIRTLTRAGLTGRGGKS